MKNWITNKFLPTLFIIVGFIGDDTTLLIGFLTEINAPTWFFTVVKYIGLVWGAKKLYEAKSSKIKKEIDEALLADPKSIGGGGVQNPK